MRVAADTGPLRYLTLIGHLNLLPRFHPVIVIPEAVMAELRHASTPPAVRAWAMTTPAWLMVRPDPPEDPSLVALDAGERAAIGLALAIGADLVLVDDRAARVAARARGLEVVGTIGLLDRGARRDLLDLPRAVAALRDTNFRSPPSLLDELLADDRRRRGR